MDYYTRDKRTELPPTVTERQLADAIRARIEELHGEIDPCYKVSWELVQTH